MKPQGILLMSLDAGERLRMGIDMTAKALVRASLPGHLDESGHRTAFMERFYGKA
jgi:hypothetical protein